MGFSLVLISMTLNGRNVPPYPISGARCMCRSERKYAHIISGKTIAWICRFQRCTDRA